MGWIDCECNQSYPQQETFLISKPAWLKWFMGMAELHSFLEAVFTGGCRRCSFSFGTWGCLQPKCFFLFPSFYKLHKFSVLCRSSQAALSAPEPRLPPAGWFGGSEAGAARQGAACLVLARAGQFILSYFPGTLGKKTMHHPKDASMKQLGCVTWFLL